MRFFLDTNYYYDSQYKIDYNKLIYNSTFKVTNPQAESLSKFNSIDLNAVDVYFDPVGINTAIYVICGNDALKYTAINIDSDDIVSETIISKTCKKIIITKDNSLNNVLNI